MDFLLFNSLSLIYVLYLIDIFSGTKNYMFFMDWPQYYLKSLVSVLRLTSTILTNSGSFSVCLFRSRMALNLATCQIRSCGCTSYVTSTQGYIFISLNPSAGCGVAGRSLSSNEKSKSFLSVELL